jgi:hypothetical protein
LEKSVETGLIKSDQETPALQGWDDSKQKLVKRNPLSRTKPSWMDVGWVATPEEARSLGDQRESLWGKSGCCISETKKSSIQEPQKK